MDDERKQFHREEMKDRMYLEYYTGGGKQRKNLQYLRKKIPTDEFEQLYQQYGDLCYDVYRVQKILKDSTDVDRLKEFLGMA